RAPYRGNRRRDGSVRAGGVPGAGGGSPAPHGIAGEGRQGRIGVKCFTARGSFPGANGRPGFRNEGKSSGKQAAGGQHTHGWASAHPSLRCGLGVKGDGCDWFDERNQVELVVGPIVGSAGESSPAPSSPLVAVWILSAIPILRGAAVDRQAGH